MKRTPLAVPVALAAAAGVFLLSPERAVSAPKEYKVVAVKEGGTLRGVCRVDKEVPRWKVSVFKDNDKGCGEKEHETQRMLVGADRALGNCLVFLKSIDAGKDWPEAMKSDDRVLVIDQKGCQYQPHVAWARAETQLSVWNSDNAEHNIHGYRDSMASTQFNFATGPKKKEEGVEAAFLAIPAVYILKCDIHPWMNAYVHVVRHPYHDLTSADAAGEKKAGEFVLTDVPPGEYELVAWHESFEEKATFKDGAISTYNYGDPIVRTQKVTVEAGKTATIDFEFEAPAAK